MDIINKIKTDYKSQSTLRRKISDYILDDPLQVSFLSLKCFSTLTKVTEATIISYCKSIGCDSFSELKKYLQSFVMEHFSQKDRLSLIASQSPTFDSLYMKIVDAEKKSQRTLYENNPPMKIEQVLKFINNASNIFIAACDATKPVADYFAKRLNSLGHPSSALNLEDTSAVLTQISSVKYIDKSLLISITIVPYSKSTLAITKSCKMFNMPIVSITDSSFSPIVKDSNINLIVPTELFGLTNSLTSLYSIINLIVILLQYDSKDFEKEHLKNKGFNKDFLDIYNSMLTDLEKV
ncbi:MAG: MurR/RpiR family transcriptional regulator [Sphaerochaetaceae bacterium]